MNATRTKFPTQSRLPAVIQRFGPWPNFNDGYEWNLQVGYLARVLGHEFPKVGPMGNPDQAEKKRMLIGRIARVLRENMSPEKFAYVCGAIVTLVAKAEVCGVERACRVCGCTEDHACDGGCSWVGGDLCSKCEGLLKDQKKDLR